MNVIRHFYLLHTVFETPTCDNSAGGKLQVYSRSTYYMERYKDPDWLREKWNYKRMSQTDIGNICGVSQSTISYYINKYGIERPWEDHEFLCYLYEDDGLTLAEIGDLMNCTVHTIYNELVDADARIRRGGGYNYAQYHTDHNGYEYWYTTVDSECRYVAVHRLLAVAEFGFDAVSDNIVHHKNGLKWDNRRENIELMEHNEHASHHIAEQIDRGQAPWLFAERTEGEPNRVRRT